MAVTTFFAKLKNGLTRSTEKLTGGIAATFTKRRLDEAALEELEDMLISVDLGPAVAHRIIENFRRTRFGKEVTETEIRDSLATEIAAILEPVAIPLTPEIERKPFVILMTGVNGSGKTTTIGKLAAFYRDYGLTPSLAAGDTFRAAAVEQLQIWGARSNSPVIAASLAHDALVKSRATNADILLIDTAGRLHNKTALMDELRKIIRVIRKLDPTAPHATLLTLDATIGQNAIAQVKTFKEMVDLTGLIVTKLDGSARAGIVVALADTFKLPVHAIGTGEQSEDLRPFDATEFARALVGLPPEPEPERSEFL
jgi:fused signal recognition particle receptor